LGRERPQQLAVTAVPFAVTLSSMTPRQATALTLVLLAAAACSLRDQNIVDETQRPSPATSSGASGTSGTSGMTSGSSGGSGKPGTSSGSTSKDGGPSSSGASGVSGSSSGMQLMCEAGALKCNGACASPVDPAFGCGDATCTPCALPNAETHACDAQACAISTCAANHADCNKVAKDGCEAVLATDPKNCGGCGIQCAADATCNGAKCTCANPELTNCGNPGVCTNIMVDTTNCGMCGKACNGNEQCFNGMCFFDNGGGGGN
jgi:hypothetical protein